MQALDLRSQRMMATLKGQIAGSVRQLSCDPGSELLCSVSLDRWARVHDGPSRKLLGKAYMKSQLTACAWVANEALAAEVDADVDRPAKKAKL